MTAGGGRPARPKDPGDGPQKHWLSKDLVHSLDARETAVDALIKLANGALHGEPAVRREVVAGSAEIGRCPLGPGREMELHRGMVFAGGPGEIVAFR